MTTVAVVEDDGVLRRSLARLVGEARGFSCLGAFSTGEEALQCIPRLLPQVVVMDIHLPNMSGIECTKRLKEKCPRIGVLMLTVYDDSEIIFEALRGGASGYLLKRSVANEILNSILSVKEGGVPMSAEVAQKVIASFRQQAEANHAVQTLTEREKEILTQISRGFSNKEIADRMFVSLSTVCTHLRHIYEKLHVRSRTEALAKMRR